MKKGAKKKVNLAVLAAGVLAASIVAFPAIAGAALVPPGASLGVNTMRVHPAITGPFNKFSIYTGGALSANGWTSLDSKVTPFDNGSNMVGEFTSEVWQNNDDGHLLLAYKVKNSGAALISSANIAGYESSMAIIDCGLMHFNGGQEFVEADLSILNLADGAFPNLEFTFYDLQLTGSRHLETGETSSWFYAEMDVDSYAEGIATLQDTGESVDGVAVFVPVPEPATMSLLVGGAAALVLVRRRRNVPWGRRQA